MFVKRRESSWRCFSAAGKGPHCILPQSEHKLGASFNSSISQREFKSGSALEPVGPQPYPLTSSTGLVTSSQNTTSVAIIFMATGRGGQVSSKPSFSPEDMQSGDLASARSETCGIWEHKKRPQDAVSGKCGWSQPILCWWRTSSSSL